jgi:hypothetical protein
MKETNKKTENEVEILSSIGLYYPWITGYTFELYKITHRGLPDALQRTQTQQLDCSPQIHHSIKSTCPPAMLMSARDL